MPDPLATYQEIVARSRAEAARLTEATLDALRVEYARMLVRIERELADGVISEVRALGLARALRAEIDRLGEQVADVIHRAAVASVQLGPGTHAEALRLAARAAGVQVTASFEAVPRRAIEAIIARRQFATRYGVDSYSGFFRAVSERAVAGLGRQVDEMLTSAVARGVSSRRLSLELAEAMAAGDPALAARLREIAPSGSVLRSVRRAYEAGELSPKLDEARKLMHKAQRVARTEVIDAYRTGNAAAASASPVVGAMVWTLSGSHSVPCECEALARLNLYGLGEGAFLPEHYPSAPHPHCACYARYKLRPPQEWSTPRPSVSTPTVPPAAEIQAQWDSTPKWAARVRTNVERGTTVAYRTPHPTPQEPVPASMTNG